VTTDGAINMIGKNLGVVARIGAEMVHFILTPLPMQIQCIIQQQELCNKLINLETFMGTVVSTVNLIRKSAFNHCHFQQFLLETKAEYGDMLYCTGDRWLSRRKMLERFF
jgi:hypothetical protein